MKHNKSIYAALAGVAIAVASCTDFADYNEVSVGDGGLSSQTLWESIKANDQLSQFATLVERAGYADDLSSSQFHTVFAPLNNTFNYDSIASLDSAALAYRFIESHVANFNHQLSGYVNTRVHTLNEKSFWLRSDNGGSFDGQAIRQANMPLYNGTLHTINGYAQFFPNVYEYIFDAEGVDSIRNYIASYQTEYLDEEASVEGPIVDGNQTYSDSVMVTYNSLTYRTMNAGLDLEDSSYTMVLPTNEAYIKAKEAIRPAYNYVDVRYYTMTQQTGSQPTFNATGPLDIDESYLPDSMTNRNIVRNIVFSENDSYNTAVLNHQWAADSRLDTLHTTTRNKLSNGYEILNGHLADGQVHEMSNGHVRIVDSLAFRPWETWNPVISSSSVLATGYATSASGWWTHSSSATNRSVRYYQVVPTSERGSCELYIGLNGVRSTTYNVYIVFVKNPSNPRPYKFGVDIMYANADGSVNGTSSAPYRLGNTTTSAIRSEEHIYNSDSILGVDTVLLERPVTFPTCYYGLDVAPYMQIKVRRSALNATEQATYDSGLRVAAVILRPVEYDEYLKPEEE